MTKTVAIAGLVAASFSLTLTNYWFTFGLWPLSWTSFFGCAFGSTILHLLTYHVSKEK